MIKAIFSYGNDLELTILSKSRKRGKQLLKSSRRNQRSFSMQEIVIFGLSLRLVVNLTLIRIATVKTETKISHILKTKSGHGSGKTQQYIISIIKKNLIDTYLEVRHSPFDFRNGPSLKMRCFHLCCDVILIKHITNVSLRF